MRRLDDSGKREDDDNGSVACIFYFVLALQATYPPPLRFPPLPFPPPHAFHVHCILRESSQVITPNSFASFSHFAYIMTHLAPCLAVVSPPLQLYHPPLLCTSLPAFRRMISHLRPRMLWSGRRLVADRLLWCQTLPLEISSPNRRMRLQ